MLIISIEKLKRPKSFIVSGSPQKLYLRSSRVVIIYGPLSAKGVSHNSR